MIPPKNVRQRAQNLLERKMKTTVCILFLALAFMAPRVQSDDSRSIMDAEKAAQDWLELTDAGHFDRSWDEAAQVLRHQVQRPIWAAITSALRSPLGSVISRKVRSAAFTRTLPGEPDGEYVIIEYETRFENKPNAKEFVESARETDSSWKIASYHIM
jgi:Protein of unknown function (DUF4019)